MSKYQNFLTNVPFSARPANRPSASLCTAPAEIETGAKQARVVQRYLLYITAARRCQWYHMGTKTITNFL
jgi:hypothetical protein